MMAGIGGLASVTQKTPILGLALSALGAFGMGAITSSAVIIVSIISPDNSIGIISATAIYLRVVGSITGFITFSNILQSQLTKLPATVAHAVAQGGLPLNETAAFVGAFLSQNKTALTHFPPSIISIAVGAKTEAYEEGFKTVYLSTIAFGGCAFMASLFLKDIRKYMVDRVAVDIH